MMLRTSLFSLALGVIMLPASSFATSLYYTFEGNVASSSDNIGGAVDSIVSAGSLRYVLMLDFERQGEATRNDGSQQFYDDFHSEQSWRMNDYDYFYADFVCGTVMNTIDCGYNNAPHLPRESNMGHVAIQEHYADGGGGTDAMTGNDFVFAQISVRGSNDKLTLQQSATGNDANFAYGQDADFSIGAYWRASQYLYDQFGNRAVIMEDLTLTQISETTPDCPGTDIPEPATLLLFGAGLVGLRQRLRKP